MSRLDEALPPGPRVWAVHGIALLAYAILVSVVGLLVSIFARVEVGEPLAWLVMVWTDNLLVDLLFLAGMVGVGIAAFRVTQATSSLVGFLTGTSGTWAIFLLSALSTRLFPGSEIGELLAEMGLADTVWLVTTWGLMGILVGGLAPVVYSQAWTRFR